MGSRLLRDCAWIWIALSVPALAAAAPAIIAHRGASGYLPEHTLEAYALAYGQGAAWIEPDLVMTRDDVLVALHDVTLEKTTDVAERFPQRAREDGHFYAIDFTLAEVETLHAIERLPARFPQTVRRFRVPRFEAMLDLVLGLNQSTGCRVGLYPEIKESAFHHAAGHDPERAVLDVLSARGMNGRESLVRIQSFEPDSLRRLREYGSEHFLVQLIDDDPRTGPDSIDLDAIAKRAQAVGPAKTLLAREPGLVPRAHALGLEVHTWTLRADQLGVGFESFEAELDWVSSLGIDALFTDFPDLAAAHFGVRRRCPQSTPLAAPRDFGRAPAYDLPVGDAVVPRASRVAQAYWSRKPGRGSGELRV